MEIAITAKSAERLSPAARVVTATAGPEHHPQRGQRDDRRVVLCGRGKTGGDGCDDQVASLAGLPEAHNEQERHEDEKGRRRVRDPEMRIPHRQECQREKRRRDERRPFVEQMSSHAKEHPDRGHAGCRAQHASGQKDQRCVSHERPNEMTFAPEPPQEHPALKKGTRLAAVSYMNNVGQSKKWGLKLRPNTPIATLTTASSSGRHNWPGRQNASAQ